MSATTMRPGTIDHRRRFWSQIEPCLGHLYIEQVDTSAIDELKQSLPDHLGPEGHHRIGRHPVASQAATGGHSMKAIQAQLRHRSLKSTGQYAHFGKRAQLRIVDDLEPSSRPHGTLTAPGCEVSPEKLFRFQYLT